MVRRRLTPRARMLIAGAIILAAVIALGALIEVQSRFGVLS